MNTGVPVIPKYRYFPISSRINVRTREVHANQTYKFLNSLFFHLKYFSMLKLFSKAELFFDKIFLFFLTKYFFVFKLFQSPNRPIPRLRHH